MTTELIDVGEHDLIDRLMPAVEQAEPHIRELGVQMRQNLRILADVFTRYPPILDERTMRGDVHSAETLIDLLFRDGCDHTVLLPTKVAVGRSLLVARSNMYGFLLKAGNGHHVYAENRERLQRLWESVVFSLLIEEVYQVIIERAGFYPSAIRRRAAVDLLHLWEHRCDRNVPEYAPIVVDLWRVRKRVAPVFGTMLGTMELLRLSSLLSDAWHGFLGAHESDTGIMQALEEFIFGLTHEQIASVRKRMSDRLIGVIDREDLRQLLGGDAPEEIESTDPREMYRFYQRRARKIAQRALADLPGPRRTLEEILLVHLLSDQSHQR